MKNQIDETIQRTQRYWYTDGLAEIAVGVMVTLIGLLYLPLMLLPQGAAALAVGLGQPLLVLLGWWLSGKAVRKLKERITYPRTGYVTYPRKKRRGWAKAAVTALCVAASVVIVQTLIGEREQLIPVIIGAFFAVTFAFMGYRLGLVRFYLLAAFGLVLGILVQQLGLRDMQQNAFYFTGLGMSWIVSGAVTLVQYLRSTRPPEAEEV